MQFLQRPNFYFKSRVCKGQGSISCVTPVFIFRSARGEDRLIEAAVLVCCAEAGYDTPDAKSREACVSRLNWSGAFLMPQARRPILVFGVGSSQRVSCFDQRQVRERTSSERGMKHKESNL